MSGGRMARRWQTKLAQLVLVSLTPGVVACQGSADLDPTIGNTGATERPAVPTSPATGTRLSVAELPSGSRYIADSTERPVYARVQAGEPCDAVCESVWPPVAATDPPAEAGAPHVVASLIGTVLRGDGRLQVTYNGRPLHYRVEADASENVRARVKDRWGEWTLVAPGGEPLPQ